MAQSRELFEICYLTFLAIYVLYCLFLYIHGIRTKEYTSFGLLASTYLAYFFFNSSFVIGSGLPPEVRAGIVAALITIFPATVLNFLVRTCRYNIDGYARWAIYPWFVLAVIALATPFMSPAAERLLHWCWGALALYSLGVAYWIIICAYRDGFYEVVPLMLGVSGLSTGLILFGAEHLQLLIVPYYTEDVAVAFFMVSVKYGFIKRYAHYMSDLRRLSGKILEAHEEERKRLARDIHDGIGQSLLAIKLNLQMMKAGQGEIVTEENLANLIDEVSMTIEELRQIAMNLRPAFLKVTSMAAILRWYAAGYGEKTGLNVIVNADDTINTDIHTKDNLYRICQEALSNALKHSGATKVCVTLQRGDGKIMLSISDNGAGLDKKKLRETEGIGISTMRERAELLEGVFRIETTPGGTAIHVGVPL
ncbi:MAG TPA: hypothetical protein ENG91_07035 [Desulfobacteraceae bacterium]|nr:hypothetical protein [Desulfobacteraceae bacterium]